MSPIRDNMVRLALSYDGAGAHDPERYLELLGPFEDQPTRTAMLTQSGCALTVRGLWRRLGLEHPRLAAPYVQGRAVEDVVTIARELDAWCVPMPSSDALPLQGDVVYVVGGEHVWTVVEADEGYCVGIDGGQLVDGHQAIARREHRISWQGLSLMDFAHSARQVRGWVDCDRLFGFTSETLP